LVQPQHFGIATKSTLFYSAAQRKVLELRSHAEKSLAFVPPRSENLLNCEQKHGNLFSDAKEQLKLTAVRSFAQRKFLNCEHLVFSRAALRG
jgi:hypothetical protein